MKIHILVVDDDKLANDFFVETLSRDGYKVDTAYSGEEALEKLQDRPFDIMLSDIRMKGMDGIELLEKATGLQSGLISIMVTAFGTVENAVKAMKLGAHDFLLKPVTPEALEIVVGRAAELIRLRLENTRLRSEVADEYHSIVGKSPRMKQLFDLIKTTANARSTVMITGESGTGKELVARAIHLSSGRRDKPFIRLNCAALPENLIESELFGYERGAFTGAHRQHKGRFEMAHTGTLLLDEISEIPFGLQSKLLRVLQEKEFERVGSAVPIEVDTRIIATSNQNLKEAIAQKRFREDLFFRLNVIPMHITPLRDRLEDIPLLVNHFIQKFSEENNKQIDRIEENVLSLFMKYHWPGNVRELGNYIERAIVTSNTKVLNLNDFPSELALGRLADSMTTMDPRMTLAELEKVHILKTLEKYDGNKTKAADALDITPRTIRNKLAEYYLETEN